MDSMKPGLDNPMWGEVGGIGLRRRGPPRVSPRENIAAKFEPIATVAHQSRLSSLSDFSFSFHGFSFLVDNATGLEQIHGPTRNQ